MTFSITPKEFERQAAQSFTGWGYRIFLVNNDGAALTSASASSAWLVEEVAGNGYVPVTGVVPGGSYNGGTGRFEHTGIEWSFTPSSGSWTVTHRGILLYKRTVANLATAARDGSGTATFTTSAPHGFAVSDSVVVSDATNAGFNGTYTVASVPDWTTFTVALAGALIAQAASAGTAVRSVAEPFVYGFKTYPSPIIIAAPQTRSGTFTFKHGPAA